MRFTCNREQLVQAISTVERAVPTRDVDDHLKGILLEAHEDRLQLTAFDLHLGIECSTPADVARQGAVMVDARLFSQLTRKLPAEQVEFVQEPAEGAANGAFRPGRIHHQHARRVGLSQASRGHRRDRVEYRCDRAKGYDSSNRVCGRH